MSNEKIEFNPTEMHPGMMMPLNGKMFVYGDDGELHKIDGYNEPPHEKGDGYIVYLVNTGNGTRNLKTVNVKDGSSYKQTDGKFFVGPNEIYGSWKEFYEDSIK